MAISPRVNRRDFEGVRALVTGASEGLGRAMSLELARRGASIVCAARTAERLDSLTREIVEGGGDATALVLDVSRANDAVEAIRAADDRAGGLDLLIANAGVGEAKVPGGPSSWEAVRDAFHTNVCGAIATLTAVFPRMIERNRGHLVGIGSLSAYGALPGALAYSAPKAALAMALDCLALDAVHAPGVTVTTVELGFVRTRMVDASTTPMPFLLEPDEAARRIVSGLSSRPRRIVLPKGLALASRVLASLPELLRREIVRARAR